MLKQAQGGDDIDLAFGKWRGLLPFWNSEADRLRVVARSSMPLTESEMAEAERLVEAVRTTMIAAEAMAIGLPTGDGRFADILHISAECEALLESLQTSLARAPEGEAPPARPPLQFISHDAGLAS